MDPEKKVDDSIKQLQINGKKIEPLHSTPVYLEFTINMQKGMDFSIARLAFLKILICELDNLKFRVTSKIIFDSLRTSHTFFSEFMFSYLCLVRLKEIFDWAAILLSCLLLHCSMQIIKTFS